MLDHVFCHCSGLQARIDEDSARGTGASLAVVATVNGLKGDEEALSGDKRADACRSHMVEMRLRS